jgi:hypothetical protein
MAKKREQPTQPLRFWSVGQICQRCRTPPGHDGQANACAPLPTFLEAFKGCDRTKP